MLLGLRWAFLWANRFGQLEYKNALSDEPSRWQASTSRSNLCRMNQDVKTTFQKRDSKTRTRH